MGCIFRFVSRIRFIIAGVDYKIFLCNTVDDLEIVEFEVGLEFSVDDGVFLKDARLVFELVAIGLVK